MLSKKSMRYLVLLALPFGGCYMASPVGPTDKIGNDPVPVPTVAATAIPGQYPEISMRILGSVPCSGATQGARAAVLRNAAAWAAWVGAPACGSAPAGALDLSSFDFSTETVLILQDLRCGASFKEPGHIWNVYNLGWYLMVRSDIGDAYDIPVNDCRSYAVAIPATNKPTAWTICQQYPSYHCDTPIIY